MNTFADRFRAAREETGLSQRAFAKRIGVTGATISNWESGVTDPDNIRSALLELAAGVLGKPVAFLRTGKDRREAADAPPGLTLAEDAVRMVPVISYVQAGYGKGAVDPYALGQGSEQIGVDRDMAAELGRLAFALVIDGESMMDEFREGDVVIIDPAVKPRPGDFVVAKVDDDESATFKKYRSRGIDQATGVELFDLVPLNPDWPTISVSPSNPGLIIGTMMEHRRRRRR
ncbi:MULTISPECIES: LexA family protein [Luteibacter]|uniref:LexA family protein n=1 Tax=Luteibacter TaxID=242605 RepID=UPI0005621D82|nr:MULTISPECIES: XRE family transcriptional regulator [unclassified Luteibacter]